MCEYVVQARECRDVLLDAWSRRVECRSRNFRMNESVGRQELIEKGVLDYRSTMMWLAGNRGGSVLKKTRRCP